MKNRRQPKLRLLAAFIAVLALVGAACSDSDSDDDADAGAEPTVEPAAPATTAAADAPAPTEAETPATTAAPDEAEAPATTAAAEEPSAPSMTADAECPLGRATEVADDPIAVRIVIVPIVDVAPIVYAQSCGFYAKHGLEVATEVAASGPAAAQLVAAGEAEMGISAWHPLAGIWLNGGPFVVAVDGAVLAAAQGAVMVLGDSDMETLADLTGRTVGVPALGSVMDAALRTALQDAGIDAAGIEIVPVPVTELNAAVASGSIDAMVSLEPFTTIGRAQGLKSIADNLYGGRIAEGTSGGLVAMKPWADANEEIIRRTRAAWAEVVNLIHADEEAFRSYLPTYTALTPELAAVIALTEYRTTTEIANIQPSVDLTAEVGLIPGTFDVSPFVAYPEG
jgi:NitT/TauT family transport system substrate-binding protein